MPNLLAAANGWKAERVPTAQFGDSWQVETTVGSWLLTARGAHPAWHQWAVTSVHLLPHPLQDRPPVIKRDGASHELLVMALNPELGDWTPDGFVEMQARFRGVAKGWFLTPLNYVHQVVGLTDRQAEDLLALVTRGLLDGLFAIEPEGILGARGWFARSLDETAAHLRSPDAPCAPGRQQP